MAKQTPRRPRARKHDYETILLGTAGGVATITMNRPEKHNACSVQMFQEIDDALSLVERDESVRAVIITGAGDQAFSAGVDFDDLEFKDLKESSAFVEADARRAYLSP